MDKPATHRKHGTNALIFVLITVMIDSIGLGLIIPVLPTLLAQLTGQPLNQAALHGGMLTLTFAIMQFIFMPIIGALSDAYGRRKVMLLSLLCLGLDYFLMGFAPTIAFLYLGRLISGAAGATYSTANAYIADVSPPEERAQNFGLIGAAFGIGFILGPALGGLLGDPDGPLGFMAGPRVPFYAAGIFALINVVYGFIFLPETLEPENRRPFEWRRANAFGAIKSLGKVSNAGGLIFVLFLLSLAHVAYPSAYTFVMLEKIRWSEAEVGLSLFAFGMSSAIVQGGLIRLAIPKFGLFWSAVIGILSAVIAYLGIGFSAHGWMIYIFGIGAAFAGFATPAINNMMSQRLSKSEQGELQGAIGAANGLALMLGPLLMTGAFYLFARPAPSTALYEPGAPFILAGLITIAALAAFLWTASRHEINETVDPD